MLDEQPVRALFSVFVLLLLCSLNRGASAQVTDNLSTVAVSDSLGAHTQQAAAMRTLSGTVLSQQNELLPGVTITVNSSAGEQQTTSDAEGTFRLEVPREHLAVLFSGRNITPQTRFIAADEVSEQLRINVQLTVPPIHESVVIVSTQLDPVNRAAQRQRLPEHALFP